MVVKKQGKGEVLMLQVKCLKNVSALKLTKDVNKFISNFHHTKIVKIYWQTVDFYEIPTFFAYVTYLEDN